MLILRLQRLGKTKQPTYRLIVSEKTKDPQAGSIEILGHINMIRNPEVVELKADRINYWLSVGAQASNTVYNLLAKQGIIKTTVKKKAVSISKKRQTKLAAKKEATAKAVEAKAAAVVPAQAEGT